jgi:hypothetical protein
MLPTPVLTTSNNRAHRLTVFVRRAGELTDEAQQALLDAGCDDAFVGERDGAQYVSFVREAKSLRRALRTALADLAEALPDAQVVRVEPDHLVTMAEIAGRAGLSREAVRLLANGQRGPGGFPPPVAYPDNRTRLWHWPDVADWLNEQGRAKLEVDAESADLVAALNAAASLRGHAASLSKRDRALVAEVLGELGSGAD